MTPETNISYAFSSTLTAIADLQEQDTWNLAETIALAADDRKAADISVLRVTDISYLADYFVLVTGFSRTQVKAIADAVEDAVQKTFGREPLRSEGKGEGSLVVQDYGEVIVHIFMPEEREFYNLEAFWGHAQRMEIPQIQATQF
jgi:ribosome-associated protein